MRAANVHVRVCLRVRVRVHAFVHVRVRPFASARLEEKEQRTRKLKLDNNAGCAGVDAQRGLAAFARIVAGLRVVAVVLARERGLGAASSENVVLEWCEDSSPFLVCHFIDLLALFVDRRRLCAAVTFASAV